MFISFFLGLLYSVTSFAHPLLLSPQRVPQKITGVYRHLEKKVGQLSVWIVDGARIREKVDPEFLYGGNDERDLFIPKNEIWIDNAISSEEYRYTVAHELLERHLMARYGESYDEAHDSALFLEHTMRESDLREAETHERAINHVTTLEVDSADDFSWLPDSATLDHIYLQHLENIDSVQVWLVSGANVRRTLSPDFAFSGNGYAYYFIPRNEIWIESDISCEETKYSIDLELGERKAMMKGAEYYAAYSESLKNAIQLRTNESIAARRKKDVLAGLPLERDIGTGHGEE